MQYLVYCGWLIIELVFVVCYVIETKGRTLEETAALFDGEQQPQVLMQQGGEAATLSRSLAARGPGIWVEQEKSIVADVVALHETAQKRVSDRSSASTSMSRYDEEVRSTHSQSRIFEAM